MPRRLAREWLWFVGCSAVALCAFLVSVGGDARKNPLGQLVRMQHPDRFFGDFDVQIAARVIADADSYVDAKTLKQDGTCDVPVPGIGVVNFPGDMTHAEMADQVRHRLQRLANWERVEGVPLEAYERAKFNLVDALKNALLAGAVLYLMIGFVRLTVLAVASRR